MKGANIMGMTDAQFKAYVRGLIARLIKAKEANDWVLIVELTEELQKALED